MSRLANQLVAAGMVFVAIATVSTAQVIHATGTFEVPVKARAKIEKIACTDPFGTGLESLVGYLWPSGPPTVRLQCRAHTTSGTRAVFAATECWQRRSWKCDVPWLNVRFESPHLPSVVQLDSVTPEDAVAIVEFLATRLKAEEIRAIWLLEREGDGLYSATLQGNGYQVKQSCQAGGCAYEIAGSFIVDY